MLNLFDWVNCLTEYENEAFGSWFWINGFRTESEIFSFFVEIDDLISGTSTKKEALISFLRILIQKQFQSLPDNLQYGITSGLGKLIKRSFEDDIHNQTINLKEWKNDFSDVCKPLGIDCNFLFSYVINIKDDAIEEIISYHKRFWPFPPHKLDYFYSQLCNMNFIDHSGHFKTLFLIEKPSLEDRILWKKNRTDLVYLAFRLYHDIYGDKFLETINKIFFIKNKEGKIATLIQLKKTYRNINDQFNPDELKGNWKSIDGIFKKLSLQ